MTAPALEARQLRKSYGEDEVVCGISFAIARGECVGILGPNGAGKSTTIQICFGATAQDSGEVNLLGHAIPADALAARRKIGVVPQNDSLDPDFSCAENLAIFARYFGLQPPPEHINRLLEFAELSARADARIPALSGGMQRRLTLARALVNEPEFIFLDEPTTGLDPQARHLIWERLRRLRADGKTLLLTTHFMEEAERLCERVYIMEGGRIIADGAPAALVRENVPREVVEVYADNIETRLKPHTNLYERHECFGQLAYCHTDDAAPLLAALQKEGLKFVHRPANLEDVFLTLTGRDLRE